MAMSMMDRVFRRAGVLMRPGVLMLAGVLLLASSSGARGEAPLMKHVPGDALAYVGWRGAENMPAAYEDSRLKDFMEATELRRRVREVLNKLAQQAQGPAQGGPHQPAMGIMVGPMLGPAMLFGNEQAREVTRIFWRRPWAGYFAGMDVPDNGPGDPVPHMGFVVKAKDDAKTLRPLFQMAVREWDEPDASLKMIDEDGVLGLHFGERDMSSTLAEAEAPGAAFSALEADEPMVAFWADFQGVMDEIEAGFEHAEPGDDVEVWREIKQVLGLDGLHEVALVGGFKAGDWSTRFSLDAPVPRRGLLKLLAGEPVRDKTLKLVPKRATWLRAFHFDLGQAFSLVKKTAAAMGDEPKAGLDQGLQAIKQQTGVDLEDDFISSLGDQWVTYSHPSFGGYMGMSFAMAQNVKQPKRLREALLKMKQTANKLMNQGGGNFPFRLQKLEMGDMTIHSFAFPMVSPGWAVADGRLYIGLSPQSISAMHRFAKKPERSILKNAKFQAMRQRLDGEQASSLMFTDLKRTADTYYQNYAMWLGMIAPMVKNETGVDLMELVPPMDTIRPHLAPAGKAFVPGEDGIESRRVSPFPGATLLSPDVVGRATSAMGPVAIGWALPGLYMAHREVRQEAAQDDVRRIVQAVQQYHNEHDAYPSSLLAMVRGEYLEPAVLVHPAMEEVEAPRAAAFKKWPKAKQQQWVVKHSGYEYVRPSEDAEMKWQTVVAYEKSAYAFGDEFVVGRGTSRAWPMARSELNERLQKQTGRGIDGLPPGVN